MHHPLSAIPPAAAARSLRTDVLLAGLLLAFTAVPTHFPHLYGEALRAAFRPALDPLDVVANVLGYIPLGIALATRRPAIAVILAGAVSLFAETTQVFYIGREPSIVDVATNVLGAAIGRALAARWRIVPERITITPAVAITAAAGAVLYAAFGAGMTAEEVLHRLAAAVDSPPWMATNARGALTPGRTEAQWSFESVAGGVVADSSENGANGRVVNGATIASGIVGSALDLNGRQWIDFDNPPALRLTGSMTVSAWIKVRAFPDDDAAVISALSPEEVGYQLDLTVDQRARTVGFKVANASGQLMARYGKTPVEADRWYHIAGVYDAPSRTIDVYLDGRRDNGCLLGTVTDRQRPSGGHVFVGRRPRLAGYEFDGLIDEARIASRALSAGEIGAEVRAARPSADLTEPAAADGARQYGGGESCFLRRATVAARIAGPVVTLGMVVAMACAGLWRGRYFGPVTLGACLLTGFTAWAWLPSGVGPNRLWVPALYTCLGGIVVIVAAATTRRSG